MNAPAAIKGTFVGMTPVASRKVVRLHVECSVEEADSILQALGGYPDPSNPKWVAIARLNVEVVEGRINTKRFRELRPSAQAALLCEKTTFWKFLWETYRVQVEDEEGAATAVRSACKVNTRASFDSNEKAANDWFNIRDKYDAWMAAA